MAWANGRDVARALEAAREGDGETLRLLTTGRKAESAVMVLGKALLAAAECGEVEALKAFLQLGASAHGVPWADESRTPLAAACAGGHTECAAALLEHGAPVDAASPFYGETALLHACISGHVDCAALLIRHGAKVDSAACSGLEPLAAAICHGHAACAMLLLDHGARVPVHFIAHHSRDFRDLRDGRYTFDWHLVPRLLLGAGAQCDWRSPWRYGTLQHTPLTAATRFGTSAAVRALCAVGADARVADYEGRLPIHWAASHIPFLLLREDPEALASGQIENALACADELIERGGAETLLTTASKGADDARTTALEAGLDDLDLLLRSGFDVSVLQRLRDGCPALMLARWPLSAPLPEYDGVEVLLPAAVGHAQRRLEVLRSGQDNAGVQQALTAALLQRVRDACGGAVAPAYAPSARFRFAAGGGLERAWAVVRKVHRYPVERVAVARAALQVASDAQAAAAERCVPLLRELSVAGGSSSNREAEKLRYAAAVAVGRWGVIRAAVSRAEEGVRSSSEAALDAAVAEAESQVGRLLQAKAAAEAAAARAPAHAG